MSHTYCTSLLTLVTSACSAAPVGVTCIGVPVDDAAVAAYAQEYATYAGGTLPASMTVDFLPHAHFESPGVHPNALLAARPVITTDAPDMHRTLQETSLAHELTHVLFGDPTHSRADLWGCPGLLSRYTGYCEGHNPANLEP